MRDHPGISESAPCTSCLAVTMEQVLPSPALDRPPRQVPDLAVEDHCQGGAPAAKRGRTTLTVIFARRHNARREEDGPATGAGAATGVRNGGWPGWRQVRGNGGAGTGPRRCAVALEAAGQAAPPATARLPAAPASYGADSPGRPAHPPCAARAPLHESGQGRTAWRAEGVPLKP